MYLNAVFELKPPPIDFMGDSPRRKKPGTLTLYDLSDWSPPQLPVRERPEEQIVISRASDALARAAKTKAKASPLEATTPMATTTSGATSSAPTGESGATFSAPTEESGATASSSPSPGQSGRCDFGDAGIIDCVHPRGSRVHAGHILQHCLLQVDRLIEQVKPPVVYKIGISANLPVRWFYYKRQDGFRVMWCLHISDSLGEIEMLEAALISHHLGKAGCRNDALGGEGLRGREGGPPFFCYAVARAADAACRRTR